MEDRSAKRWEYRTSWPPAREGAWLHPFRFAGRGPLPGQKRSEEWVLCWDNNVALLPLGFRLHVQNDLPGTVLVIPCYKTSRIGLVSSISMVSFLSTILTRISPRYVPST